MSSVPKRYCVFGCDFLVTFCVPVHRFPHPIRKPDVFNAWVSAVGDKLQETDRMKIYKSKRLCDHHQPSASPTVNLHRIQQGCTTFLQADHCYTRPLRESLQSVPPLMDITNLPGPTRPAVSSTENSVPSGSTETTCLTTSDKTQVRTPCTKFDAEKTFEFLRQETSKDCTKKNRHKETEIRRLRKKIQTFKLRLRELKNDSARRDFEKLTQNMSKSAKLFTRMQLMEGCKKKKGHRFTTDEKILSLIYRSSSVCANIITT